MSIILLCYALIINNIQAIKCGKLLQKDLWTTVSNKPNQLISLD